jgi:hypothetical protein
VTRTELDAFDAFDALDLPTIDLTASEPGDTLAVPLDRRSYEERFAELGFGLGVVPRKQRRDDAWWETPAGMLALIGIVLLLLWVSASAS